MDKQSFSRYGGIVIVVIILSMMIAFATPFGSFVVNGVKNVLGNFDSTGGNAMDNDYGDFVDFPYPGTGSGGNNGGSGGSEEQTIAPGLYETGSDYETMIMSWDELVSNGILSYDGVIQSGQAERLVGDLVLPKMTTINNWAFDSCESLTSVIIPDGVTTIGDCAFAGTAITSIHIPDSVTTIGNGAFFRCESLASVTFGENCQLTTISGAFNSCTALTSIKIPDSVTIIGQPFSGCTNLTTVEFGENSQLTTISSGAFQNCSALTSIAIPDGVTTIEWAAFQGCTNLTSVTFSENSQLTQISMNAFESCKAITSIGPVGSGASVEIPDSVTTIEFSAFQYCTSLTSVTFSDNSKCKYISYTVFSGCTALTSVTIPAIVTNIYDQAFENCTKLTNITFKGTMAQWNAITKGKNWNKNVPVTTVVTCSDGTVSLR